MNPSGRLAALIVTTAPAATTTATATIATAEFAARTAGWAIFTRAGFVDGERTALHGLAVEEADRLLRVFRGGHGDEGEAAGLARGAVLHQHGFRNGAALGEKILEIDFEGLKGKISYVEFAIS